MFRELRLAREQAKKKLLGVGLDAADEHVRITRGENFHLVGGSKDTHEQMQEKCIKMNEKLDARGKTLERLDRKEFLDLASECGMNIAELDARQGRKEQ